MFLIASTCVFLGALEDWSTSRFIFVELVVVVPASVLFGYGYSLLSRLTVGGNVYEVDDVEFRVINSGEILTAVAVSSISSFQMRKHVDAWSFFSNPFPPPSWPRGVLRVEAERGLESMQLPPLLIWGRGSVRQVERQIRAALFRSSPHQSPSSSAGGRDDGDLEPGPP
jgi:hypothetical protein